MLQLLECSPKCNGCIARDSCIKCAENQSTPPNCECFGLN